MAITHVYIDLKLITVYMNNLVGRDRIECGHVMCSMYYMLQSIQSQNY